MKPVVIGEEAGQEIREAVDYLNHNRPGIGDEFEADIHAAMVLIGKQPKAFSLHRKRFRKCVVKRFGYLIFYVEFDEHVWVIAVAHGKRRPDYWIRRKPT